MSLSFKLCYEAWDAVQALVQLFVHADCRRSVYAYFVLYIYMRAYVPGMCNFVSGDAHVTAIAPCTKIYMCMAYMARY